MARPFKYTANEIESLFEKYKADRAKQFDIRYELIKSGDRAGEVIEVRLPKVWSIVSFCLFIGITEKTFFNYLNGDSENIDAELIQVLTHVRNAIADFQLSGATNGIYNANIVARMNGLSDRTEVTNVGEKETINISIDGSKVDLSK